VGKMVQCKKHCTLRSLTKRGAKFSEIVNNTSVIGPPNNTEAGRAVPVASADERDRKSRRQGNLAEFFASSPLPGADLDTRRVPDGPRELHL
jgi:hypothetical protein